LEDWEDWEDEDEDFEWFEFSWWYDLAELDWFQRELRESEEGHQEGEEGNGWENNW